MITMLIFIWLLCGSVAYIIKVTNFRINQNELTYICYLLLGLLSLSYVLYDIYDISWLFKRRRIFNTEDVSYAEVAILLFALSYLLGHIILQFIKLFIKLWV